jgi:hypothetical protein
LDDGLLKEVLVFAVRGVAVAHAYIVLESLLIMHMRREWVTHADLVFGEESIAHARNQHHGYEERDHWIKRHLELLVECPDPCDYWIIDDVASILQHSIEIKIDC